MPPKQLVKVDAPIPAFYCCYLLRSRNHKSYYIGSTPNPARRLRQHNGECKGGAKKTSGEGNKPWEITCIVTGFTSKFAALQFEWAWQNTHLTRHIEKDVRAARVEAMKKEKKKTTLSPTKRKQRPPMSLKARLENLHYLLGAKSFVRWPLRITFFSPDVFKSWELYSGKLESPLREGVMIQLIHSEDKVLRLPAFAAQMWQVPSVIRDIKVAYEDCKDHVEKSQSLFESGRSLSCAVCKTKMDRTRDLLLVCPLEGCRAVTHLQCLSDAFLREEKSQEALVPVGGTCPSCRTRVSWVTLVKELSLRIRGEEEIKTLFKPKRKKKQAPERASQPPGEEEENNEEDEELDDDWVFRVDDDE